MGLYAAVSARIRRILDTVSPVVEPLSIDEALVDLTGIAADLEAGRDVARALKARIRTEERLGASVGIAHDVFLAKLASDLEKPDGLVVLRPEDLPSRVWPLPIERLWGVGPRTGERLRRGGVAVIGDVLRLDEARLASIAGPSMAAHLRALAAGRDERPVVPSREAKSISEERTYTDDLTREEEIDRALLARAEGVARELRRAHLVARTVQLKLRTADFTTWTRAMSLDEPTDLAEPIVNAARRLVRRIERDGRGVRLIGVGVSGLAPAGHGQQRLFVEAREIRRRRLVAASDLVRDRLGERALRPARLIRSGPGRPRATKPIPDT
jgi:DNA polymerase-4